MVDQLLSIREAAALLGISERYVYQLFREGELPGVQRRKGARVRFRRSDIEQVLRDSYRPASVGCEASA